MAPTTLSSLRRKILDECRALKDIILLYIFQNRHDGVMEFMDDTVPSSMKSNEIRIYPEKTTEKTKKTDGTHILEWGHVPWKWRWSNKK